jgi:hypothetical protein
MHTRLLLLTLVVVFSVAAAILFSAPNSGSCPQPSARSVEDLFAPCLAQEANNANRLAAVR